MELQFLAFLLSRKKVCLSEYVVLLLKNYAFDNLVVARVVAIAIVCGGGSEVASMIIFQKIV